MNHIHDYVINVTYESDFKLESVSIKVMGKIEDISLKILDEDFKKIEHWISNLRVPVLQMLCLVKLYTEEKFEEKRPNLIEDAKEVMRDDEIEFFQKKLLQLKGIKLYFLIKE